MSSRQARVFGPVVSRRLGMSLGVDVVPMKTCSFNCIYCQLGRTAQTTVERRRYSDPEEIAADVTKVLGSRSDVDYITLSGSGEPTLEARIGDIIHLLKRVCPKPVALLTNGSMFVYPDVRKAVLEADLILPSLDAASEDVFRKINRPHESLTLERVARGLENLRREYTGQIWLEVMLVKGMNDDESELRNLARLARRIRPDRIQLNTVVRPPTDAGAEALDPAQMEAVRRMFGPNADIIADVLPAPGQSDAAAARERAVLSLAERRPVTAEEVSAALNVHLAETVKVLATLEKAGKLSRTVHHGKTFYIAPDHDHGAQ